MTKAILSASLQYGSRETEINPICGFMKAAEYLGDSFEIVHESCSQKEVQMNRRLRSKNPVIINLLLALHCVVPQIRSS